MRGVPLDLRAVLLVAMRVQAGRGPHAEAARQVILAVLMAQMLAGAQHDGPPHAARRPPRHHRPRRTRAIGRGSVAGRRPRG
jgi:hypothetical protein